MPRPKLSAPPKSELEHLYVERGLTQKETAAELNTSARIVRRWLKEHSIPIRKPNDTRSIERPPEAKLRELYEGQGLTYAEIADVFDVSKPLAGKWCRAIGITGRTGKISAPDAGALRALYIKEQKGAREIGEQYGCSKNVVLRWLKEAGIDRAERNVEIVCAECEATFTVKPSRAETAKFCSDACRFEGQKGRPSPQKISAPPKEELADLYIGQELIQEEIADHYGVSVPVVCRWFKEYGIETRRGALKEKIEPPPRAKLKRMYADEEMGTREIGEALGTSKHPVLDWLYEYDIPLRKSGRGLANRGKRIPPDDVLRILYLEWQLSIDHIAKLYDLTGRAVWDWLRKAGIERRQNTFNPHGRVIANDGTVVRSLYEMRVANWLFGRGIEYTYEPAVPFEGRGMADFKARGWFIEVWGVSGSSKYKARRKEKERKYEQCGANLLGLERWHFDPPGHSYRKHLEEALCASGSQFTLFP